MPNSCQFRATSNPILKRGRARKIRKKLAPCGHRVPLVNPQPRAFATTFRKIDQRRTVNARVGFSIELKSGSRRVRPVSLRVSTKIATHISERRVAMRSRPVHIPGSARLDGHKHRGTGASSFGKLITPTLRRARLARRWIRSSALRIARSHMRICSALNFPRERRRCDAPKRGPPQSIVASGRPRRLQRMPQIQMQKRFPKTRSPPPPRIVLDNVSRRIPEPNRFDNASRRIPEKNRRGNVGGGNSGVRGGNDFRVAK